MAANFLDLLADLIARARTAWADAADACRAAARLIRATPTLAA